MTVEFVIKNNSRPIISLNVEEKVSDIIRSDFTLYMMSTSPTPDLYFKTYEQEGMEVIIDLRVIASIMIIKK